MGHGPLHRTQWDRRSLPQAGDADLSCETFCDAHERLGLCRVGLQRHDRGPGITRFADVQRKRDIAEEWHFELLSRQSRPAVAEDVMFLAAVVADERTHVFEYAQNANLEALKGLESLDRDVQAYPLGLGHYHNTRQWNALSEGQGRVTGSRGVQRQVSRRLPPAPIVDTRP